MISKWFVEAEEWMYLSDVLNEMISVGDIFIKDLAVVILFFFYKPLFSL